TLHTLAPGAGPEPSTSWADPRTARPPGRLCGRNPAMPPLHDFTLRDIDGRPRSLGAYRGQVVLVVNVASRCGLTPHYEGLQKLHASHAARGFSVLGFPCNQFAGQEPGSDAEVKEFACSRYGVEFPLFSK